MARILCGNHQRSSVAWGLPPHRFADSVCWPLECTQDIWSRTRSVLGWPWSTGQRVAPGHGTDIRSVWSNLKDSICRSRFYVTMRFKSANGRDVTKRVIIDVKEILRGDNTILWISKLCSCVDVRWCFIGLVWWLRVKRLHHVWVRNQNFTTGFQGLESHQFTIAFV